MQGTCCCTRWHRGHEAPSSFVGMGTSVKNDSKSVRACLSAFLVSLERRSSSCSVIRAWILASCANMSKQKEYWVLWKDFSSKFHQSESPAFLCPLALGPGQVQRFLTSLVGELCQVWSYYHKYCLSKCVPTGCKVTSCVAKASSFPSEPLRETTVTESLSVARETTLHD